VISTMKLPTPKFIDMVEIEGRMGLVHIRLNRPVV
jgi:hypothetical protein